MAATATCVQGTMGKRTKMRELRRRLDDQALTARLRQHKQIRASAKIASWREFSEDQLASIERYGACALRSPQEWGARFKVRDPQRRFLEFVKFIFGRYPIPRHLEAAWLLGQSAGYPDFRRWAIIAGQGQSLYRHGACRWLSRAETHHFLAAPGAVKTAERAMWYATARVEAATAKIAVKVARSRIVECPPGDTFWKTAAAYMARHPMSLLQMNETIAYLAAARAVDAAYSLTGRTPQALRRRIDEWQRLRGLVRQSWVGFDLPNKAYQIEGSVWRFKQIRSSLRLYEEGRRLSHCVVGYTAACVCGETGIWSLTCEREGRIRARLTIEVAPDLKIWMVRGFANRAPTPEEEAIIAHWAGELGLTWADPPALAAAE